MTKKQISAIRTKAINALDEETLNLRQIIADIKEFDLQTISQLFTINVARLDIMMDQGEEFYKKYHDTIVKAIEYQESAQEFADNLEKVGEWNEKQKLYSEN